MLGYRIDLYFHDYKLAIGIDQNSHRDRNIDYEVKGKKAIEQELGFKFVRIDPDKEDFDTFKASYETFVIRYYETLGTSNNRLINSISVRLLGLEFKSIFPD